VDVLQKRVNYLSLDVQFARPFEIIDFHSHVFLAVNLLFERFESRHYGVVVSYGVKLKLCISVTGEKSTRTLEETSLLNFIHAFG
jgi:hypothetical protein